MDQPIMQIIPRDEYPAWPDGSPFPLVLAVFNLANIALNHEPVEQRCMLERIEKAHGLPVVMHVKEVMRKYGPKPDARAADAPRRRARVSVFDPSLFAGGSGVGGHRSAVGGETDD